MQGHTSCVYAAKFMPNNGNEHIITAAADRQVCINTLSVWPVVCLGLIQKDWLQIRHINLHKNAIKPYSCHHGRVRALVPIDSSKKLHSLHAQVRPFHFLTCQHALSVRASADLFVSGSDDGTARHFDTRESVSSQDAADVRKGDIIGEQRNAFHHIYDAACIPLISCICCCTLACEGAVHPEKAEPCHT